MLKGNQVKIPGPDGGLFKVVTRLLHSKRWGVPREGFSALSITARGPWNKPNLRKGLVAGKVHPYRVDSEYTPRLIKIELKDSFLSDRTNNRIRSPR